MTAVSAVDNTTTLTQQNDEIITIENRQINEINDSSAGIDTNSGLEQILQVNQQHYHLKTPIHKVKNLKLILKTIF